MLSFHAYETNLVCPMLIFHFPMVKNPFPDISSPKVQKCLSILFQIASVFLGARFGELQPTIAYEMRRPQIWTTF